MKNDYLAIYIDVHIRNTTNVLPNLKTKYRGENAYIERKPLTGDKREIDGRGISENTGRKYRKKETDGT